MSLLTQLVRLLVDEDRDLDAGFDEFTELTAALIDSADLALVPELEAHLEAFLEREDFYGRDVIGEVLAGVAGLDALPVLLRASTRDLGDDQDTFQMIICDLLHDDPLRARPAVLGLLDADDGELRATGVWALDFIASDEDLPWATAALRDPDPRVRSAAAGPVGRLAQRLPEAMDEMAAALKDRDPQVRISVLSSLGYTKSYAAVPHVMRLRNDPDRQVREWAAIALNQLPKQPLS